MHKYVLFLMVVLSRKLIDKMYSRDYIAEILP